MLTCFLILLIQYSLHEKFCQRIVVYNIKYIQIYLQICTCEMLLYTLNLGFFILGFAIYPVAYGVGFHCTGPTHSHMDFKLQTTTHSGRTIFQCT